MNNEQDCPEKQMPKILVVDDSSSDRQTVIKTIRQGDFKNHIFEAADGEQALEILSGHYEMIGLICLDWQMPKVDGMEFMRGVIKVPQTASIPIVMITASGTTEAQNCAYRVNPRLAGYVVKPYQPEDLIEVISPYLAIQ